MSNTTFDPPPHDQPAPRRGSSGRWWLLPLLGAAIIVPLVLAALATFTGIGPTDHIESQLADRSKQALSDAGFPDAKVSFDGRDATVENVTADQAQAAADTVSSVDGVRTAKVSAEAAKPAPQETERSLTVAAVGNRITLAGTVPDQGSKDAIATAARANANGREVVDEQLTVVEGARGTDAGVVGAALTTGGAGDRTIAVAGDTVTITGTAPSEQDKAAVGEKVGAAIPGAKVNNQLTVAAPGPPAPPAPPPPPAFDKAALQQQINGLIAQQAITFQPDTSQLTGAGADTVAKVADLLKGNPQARVEVDGFVAEASGPGGNAQNLSQQRAGAVKDQLSGLGIDAGRIEAVGFGADRPIAPNNTAAGQAANRRVEIVVL